MKLERKPIFDSDTALSRYWHPNGWVITQHERDWDLRGYPRGGGHGTSEREAPKRWWEVRARGVRRRFPVETFRTLREARAWCDERVAFQHLRLDTLRR